MTLRTVMVTQLAHPTRTMMLQHRPTMPLPMMIVVLAMTMTLESFFGILAGFEAQVKLEERRLGNDLKSRKAHFRSLLINEADSEKEKQAETSATEIMSVADVVKAPNSRQRVRGEDKPSQLYGYYSYSALTKKINRDQLIKELQVRGIGFNNGVIVGVKLLKEDEAKWFQRAIEAELIRLGDNANGLRSLKEKRTRLLDVINHIEEEEYNGEWDIDIGIKFKAMAAELDFQKLKGITE